MSWMQNELAYQESLWQGYGESNGAYLKRLCRRLWTRILAWAGVG